MSFNKIYSGMENAPDAIDKNFNTIDDWAGEIGDPALLAKLSEEGTTNWDSGNFKRENGTWKPELFGSEVKGNHTYSSQVGIYSIKDDICFFDGSLTIRKEGFDSSISGDIRLTVPIPIAESTGVNIRSIVGFVLPSTSNYMFLEASKASQCVKVMRNTTNGGWGWPFKEQDLDISVVNTILVNYSGWYFIE